MLRWRLLLEEYLPIIKYIKGPRSGGVYTLSWILFISSDVIESDIVMENLSDIYCVNKLDSDTLPITYQNIYSY